MESAFKCGQISTHFYKSVSKIDRYLLYFNPFSTNQFSSTLAISTLFALAKAKIFKYYEKAGHLQACAEEIETLLLEKLERWETLEAKLNGDLFRYPDGAFESQRLPEK